MPVEYDPIALLVDQARTGSTETGTLTTIIELALERPPKGSGAPDRLTWHRLLAIAELLVESGMRGEAAHYGVAPIASEISDRYEIRHWGEGTPLIDMGAFRRDQMARVLPIPWAPDSPVKQLADTEESGEGGGVLSIWPKLANVDKALCASAGCGLDALLGALICLQTWPVTPEGIIAEATREEIVAFCCSDGNLEESEVAAAIDLLTLHGTDLGKIEPWEFSKRAARLVTRPLIAKHNGRLLVLPWWIGQSARTYVLYLEDGRFPWPEEGMDPRLKGAIDRYRQEQNAAFEREIEAALRAADFAVRPRIKPHDSHLIGLTALSGEIDALAGSPSGDTLWVIEAKDPARVHSVSEMERAVRSFGKPGTGYIDKLARKVADVSANPTAVAQSLGLPPGIRTVRGVMVTRRPVPAGYMSNVTVPFITIDNLIAWLMSAEAQVSSCASVSG